MASLLKLQQAIGGHPWTSVAFSLLLGCVAYVAYYRLLHPLARFPGPLAGSLCNLPKLEATVNEDTPYHMTRLHAKYGPVVRFGPNDLSFNSPEAMNTIYRSGWSKGAMYLGFQIQKEPGLFSDMDEVRHGKRRRIWAKGFAMPYIRDMEPYIDSRYAVLRQQLDGFAKTGEVFDLREYITYYVVDLFGELAFGQAFGNQEACDPAKIPPVSDALYGALVAGQVPWAAPVIIGVGMRLPSARSTVEGNKRIFELAGRNVKARAEGKTAQRKDMLAVLMTAHEEKAGKPLTMRQTIVEASTMIVGGTHTTGTTLHILFANLARNPEHLKRFVQELDERLPPLEVSQAAYRIAGLEEKLDFVNMAIRENFRKDPVATFNMPRTVPIGGADIGGFHVPGSAQCSLNIHAFHHNPDVWGADHDVFDPTRWYDSRAQNLGHLVIPYSVGIRSCVGQNLANTNVLKMATTLLRCYDFDFLNADEPMRIICHGDSELKTPVMVKCKRRGPAFEG